MPSLTKIVAIAAVGAMSADAFVGTSARIYLTHRMIALFPEIDYAPEETKKRLFGITLIGRYVWHFRVIFRCLCDR